MRLTPERTNVTQPKNKQHPLDQTGVGRSLTPPAFQLLADSNAAGKVAAGGPVAQRQPVSSSKENEQVFTNVTPDLVDASWQAFADAFNPEFQSVLHAFAPKAEAPLESSPEQEAKSKKVGKPGKKSGDFLTAKQLKELFTEGQRDLLMGFMKNHEIPDRLFNGDEVGKTTAQQRLLLAGHILVKGSYKPGSFSQKVHARMCFHWVQIVHHYAGATPQSGGSAVGVMGDFDHGGNAVLGTGKTQQVFFGKKVAVADLPEKEEGGIGPLPEGSAHAEAGKKEDAKVAANPDKKRRIHRRKSLPMSRFGELKAGDWLWYYNANGSGGGAHSVIFSRWATEKDEAVDGVPFRTAIVFSQGLTKTGGREHTTRLGGQFYNNGKVKISPITWVSRVSEDSHPAQTADEVLPKKSAKREERLSAQNRKYLKRIERQNKGSVDIDALKDDLRARSKQDIAAISDRLTDGQTKMLLEVTKSESLEDLVKLAQRVGEIRQNSGVLAANMKKTFGDKLDAKHAEVSAANVEWEQKSREEALTIDFDLGSLLGQLKKLEEDKEGLVNPKQQIKTVSKANRVLKRKIRILKRKVSKDDPDLHKMIVEQEKLVGSIQKLVEDRTAFHKESKRLKKEIRGLKKQKRSLEVKRIRVIRKYAKKKGVLPYGMTHPGGLRGQSKQRVKGLLKQIYDRKAMKKFMVVGAE